VRPSYPESAVSYIHDVIGGKEAFKVADIGCGTGKFTEVFLAHPAWKNSVSELIAVEPVETMRDAFAKTITDKRVTLQEGTFEHSGIPDAWADVVIAAQAFHWCTDQSAALAELKRILKPGGSLVLVWNVDERDKAKWLDELWKLYSNYSKRDYKAQEDTYHVTWHKMLDLPGYDEVFEKPLQREIFENNLVATRDLVVQRYLTWSAIGAQSDEEKEKIKEKVAKIVDDDPNKTWLDEKEGVFQWPHRTFVDIIRRN